MKIYLIRHGMTKGNGEKRYVGGRTDEKLSPSGIEELQRKSYPQVEKVFTSPMKRCIQTAEILYPDKETHVVEEFRETDFGRFENKNYQELKDDLKYQAWLRSGGTSGFPEGESQIEVRNRVLAGLGKVAARLKEEEVKTAALIVHGGTVMYIMEAYGREQKSFYEYQIKCGEYICLDVGDGISKWEKER